MTNQKDFKNLDAFLKHAEPHAPQCTRDLDQKIYEQTIYSKGKLRGGFQRKFYLWLIPISAMCVFAFLFFYPQNKLQIDNPDDLFLTEFSLYDDEELGEDLISLADGL